jgi:hypothetical protein
MQFGQRGGYPPVIREVLPPCGGAFTGEPPVRRPCNGILAEAMMRLTSRRSLVSTLGYMS